MIFTDDAKKAFEEHYPKEPVKLAHALAGDNFFTLDRLAEIAATMPPELVEYNRGDLAVDQDPTATPANGLDIEETIRSIEENGSWLVLKNVERDSACARKLRECLNDLHPQISAASGEMFRKEGFIFVSSPGSVTPFHMDPEHNILMQVRGTKQMRIYDPHGAHMITPEQHETYHVGGHRNLPYDPSFDERSQLFELAPGDAVHVPVKAPHWVQNGPAVSISFSITWRSRLSVAEADLHRMNAWLRRQGLKPPSAASTARNGVKVAAYRMLNRTGLISG